MREEVGAERGVDVGAEVDGVVHLLVDEGGMEVAGVEGDEAKRRASICSNCHSKGHHTGEHDEEHAHLTEGPLRLPPDGAAPITTTMAR